jgi:cephalosporin hydroxylase
MQRNERSAASREWPQSVRRLYGRVFGYSSPDVLPIIQERVVWETSYFGVKALKSPLDFWIYQEIISEAKPDVIVEIGNKYGGGTLALAHLCDLLGKGRVIGLDITHDLISEPVKKHPRITLIEGDACENFQRVAALIGVKDRALVIEDSSHTYDNTLNVLRTFSVFTKPGDYFIVEDGICHHGLDVGPDPGPYEAIEAFLAENPEFVADRGKEGFLITWNPKGYLKRVATGMGTSRVQP